MSVVRAWLAACFDVSGMHYEVDVVVPVDLGYQTLEARLHRGAVRHVADECEREGCNSVSPSWNLRRGANLPVCGAKQAQNDKDSNDRLHSNSSRGGWTPVKVMEPCIIRVTPP